MKKLGIINYLINFILLPCIIITYTLSLLNNIIYIVLSFNDTALSFVVYEVFICFAIFFVIISAIRTTIAIAKCHNTALSWIGSFLILYCAERILSSIYLFASKDNALSFGSILFGLLPFIVISILIFKYYKNRRYNFNQESNGNGETFIGFVCITAYLSLLLIEGISLYEMFSQSVGYGLFGLFVPVVSQMIHVFNSGFNSPFAYMIYGSIILYALTIIIPVIFEYCDNFISDDASEFKNNKIDA